MMIIVLLLLLAPGFISLRILWSGKTINHSNCLSFLSDYMIYSFLIMLCTYGFMFLTYPDRTVSFSVNMLSANSSVLSASFVVKYSLVSLLSALILPIVIPRLVGVFRKLEKRRKRILNQSSNDNRKESKERGDDTKAKEQCGDENTVYEEFTLHPQDFILQFCITQLGQEKGLSYYFEDGKRSADKLKNLCQQHFPNKINLTLFEFASGYGCITRNLDKSYFDVTSCDIHTEAMSFIQSNFNAKTILSTTNPEDFFVDKKYDVVFALSFFSHMPDRTFGKWLKALWGLVDYGGVLIFTTHGRVSNEMFFNLPVSDGFAFQPDSEQKDLDVSDYGTTVSEYQYVKKACEEFLQLVPSDYKEAFWWEHQDVYIVNKS